MFRFAELFISLDLLHLRINHERIVDWFASMTAIRDRNQLVVNGGTELNRKARALALKGLEAALNAADPRKIVKSKLTLKDSTLTADKYSFDLSKFSHIYVIGGGKASGPMAEALEEVLDNRITKGLVNVPRGCKSSTRTVLLGQWHEA